MHVRQVTSRIALQFHDAAPGLRSVDMMASMHAIEPFLVFTEFHMDRPVFGPHPHAGISVMTYLLPQSPAGFINRDSRGDRSRIAPGGLHITQAGRGIFHDEYPEVRGVSAHGFQIWINHAESDREVEPLAMHTAPSDVGVWRGEGVTARVLHGHVGEVAAAHRMVTDVMLLHVTLAPHARFSVPAAAMSFVYTIGGQGESAGAALHAQTLAIHAAEPGVVELIAGADGLDVMLGSGTPLGEPVVYGGPFVASSPAQLRAMRRRHAEGGMGWLAPAD